MSFKDPLLSVSLLVLLRSSRSISRSRSSTAIERDRNRDLSCSIFADFRWAMASACDHQGHYGHALDFVRTEALRNGMTSADVLFTLTSPHCLTHAKPQGPHAFETSPPAPPVVSCNEANA